MKHAYLFEAKHIQEYILSGGKLKDMIGGSELVESLCPDLVDKLIAILGPEYQDGIKFSRKAGGAFYAFSPDHTVLQTLSELWALTVRLAAPGLAFVQAIGSGENEIEAFENAREKLRLAERQPINEPVRGNPFVLRNPRTGRLACAHDQEEVIEIDLVHKREARERHAVMRRFSPNLSAKAWPSNLEPSQENVQERFPFLPGQNHVAIVHADGNGLGNLLRVLAEQARLEPKRFIELFRYFSEAVQNATESAAQYAVETVLNKERSSGGVMPARPIILGGDDLTIIVRADLAIRFTASFLEAFERESEKALSTFQKNNPLSNIPSRLTACAGIAYARYSQPFSMVHGIAEELCSKVKTQIKKQVSIGEEIPSALAFHRLTGTSQSGLGDVLLREKMSHHADSVYHHGLPFYTLHETEKMPSLNTLLEVDKTLADIAGGAAALRQYLGTLYNDPERAATLYRRWRRRTDAEFSELLHGFDTGLKALVGDLSESHPYSLPEADSRNSEDNKSHVRVWKSPLADLLTIYSMQRHASKEEIA